MRNLSNRLWFAQHLGYQYCGDENAPTDKTAGDYKGGDRP